jgi:hypothetical protein
MAAALIGKLRSFWRDIVATVGIAKRIVPHQLRPFGTEILRAGVGFAAVMKLLGHLTPAMPVRYVEVCLLNSQREFQLARSQPRHLLPHHHFLSRSVRPNPTSPVCSIPFISLSTFWKCSAALFSKDPTVVSSTALPIASPRSLQKPKNSGKSRDLDGARGRARDGLHESGYRSADRGLG